METSPSNGGARYWRWGLLAALAITLLSVFPQLRLWHLRGADYQGSYAVLHEDEFVYSAYVNALIDGRPRRNNPFAAEDDRPGRRLAETHFSIQFVPPVVIAALARAFGVSAATAFVVLLFVAGLAAALSIFWLIASITGDGRLAAAGTIFVLCMGTIAAGQGIVGLLLDPHTQFFGLLFLRRYQPSAAFPLFFVLCALVWRALTARGARAALACAALAGLTLATLIFSYLFLWTAAAAWLACVAALWLLARPAERRRAALVFSVVAAIAALALVPYALLLAGRPENLDAAQTLIHTRRPDLLRLPTLIGAGTLLMLFITLRRGGADWRRPEVLFAAAFALLPLAVFNQQIVTGRSMQPFHYEIFVANYAALVGLVLGASLLRRHIGRRALALLTLLCLLWGTVEVGLPAVARSEVYVADDELARVGRRLKELAAPDGTWAGLRGGGRAGVLFLSPEVKAVRMLATYAPQGSLLGLGSQDFGVASHEQTKEFLHTHLYYTGVDGEGLRRLLSSDTEDRYLSLLTRNVIFGHERLLPFLTIHYEPIRQDEIEAEVKAYEEFIRSFTSEHAARHALTYLVTRAQGGHDFSNLDRWYVRDEGEHLESRMLYRLTPRF